MSRFSQRSTEKELMDDLECSGPVLQETLKELKTINRWLGGNKVTLTGLKKLMKAKPQGAYFLTDIGCGGGDMIRIMANWASKEKIIVNFEGVDANANIIELAKKRQKDIPQVHWKVQNVFEEEFQNDPCDIVTCTLFTHHFTDQELVDLFGAIRKKARIGMVINDLHRHPIAFHSIRVLTSLFSKSPMVKHDASLSVLRSFSRSDWEKILFLAGITQYRIRWYWAFRWQIIISF
ncbi:methyltransferase domain-containing protein [Algoriphagus mannitolivorans]|uniref:methyltransferase domain-containing protein n=1 Tax=Algoriphagus mannitolivorans TaxID=226504 RepID=UPI0004007487|nr:methyltransferase domain-containing protein [Algoriphagus mannitolivorans]